MYGAHVLYQLADCTVKAKDTLINLAGSSIRIEADLVETDCNDIHHYYLYPAEGTSIEDLLVRSGTVLVWSQNGQYLAGLSTRRCRERSR
ncbi:MAG: hypothetical protein CL726_05730 [Chloroflexi bacterium]|nr:hypothetical protein [Chloroflexota bacterium]